MSKQKNLKQKAASGMIWTSIQKVFKTGIQFISGIILARLLTPFDYGCIGMLMVFVTLAESFIDGGFGSALIQKKRPTQTDYSTIFYWNLGLSALFYAILFFSAPVIASFYEISLLRDVLRVQGLILFIYALNLIQRNQLRKQLKFKVIAVARIVTSIIALVITIIMAYKGFGVWALVAQNLIAAGIPAIIFWVYTKWKPSFVFSWQSFKELFSFGFFMFLTQLINRISIQIQNLFIGKFYDASVLGYFSKAQATERLASHTISDVMSSVTYPLYAEVQDDLPAMQNMIKRLTTTIAYLTFPLLVILLLTARPLFILLYSERWIESIPYFQLLCIAGLGYSFSAINTQPIAAIGKSKTMLMWTIVKRLVGLFAILVGLFVFGIYGLLVGSIFNSWFSYFVNIWLVSKYVGYRWTTQLKDLLPISISVLFAGCVSYLVGNMLGLGLYADGMIKFVVFGLLYLCWSHFFKPESYMYTKSIVMPMIAKYKQKFMNE